MRPQFRQFMEAQDSENKRAPAAEIKLGDKSGYPPFIVDSYHNPNLREIIKAFGEDVPLHRTVDKQGAVVDQKLGKKKLYLVGGAVRDHLMGKTPKDMDLATDAHPDEIKLILKNAGFTEAEAQGGDAKKKKSVWHDDSKEVEGVGSKNKVFYVKGWDGSGQEFVIGAKVNGEEFEIATFRQDSKASDGRTPESVKFSGLNDDADRRDLTINSMYIPLTNADGANNKLIDPHSGMNHLASGEVRFVGNVKDRLEEDQLRAFRYIRFFAAYDRTGKIPDEYAKAIKELSEDGYPAVSKERIRDEFIKGLSKDGVDPKMFVRMYHQLGLLKNAFPGMNFEFNVPEQYSDETDKHLAVAWILRRNDPEKVVQTLKSGTWTNEEVKKIGFLLKFLQFHPDVDPNELEQFYNGFLRSGVSSTKLQKWWKMNMADEGLESYRNKGREGMPPVAKADLKHLKAFADFAKGDRTSPTHEVPAAPSWMAKIMGEPEAMKKVPAPGFEGLQGRAIGDKVREMEHARWKNIWQQHNPPQNV